MKGFFEHRDQRGRPGGGRRRRGQRADLGQPGRAVAGRRRRDQVVPPAPGRRYRRSGAEPRSPRYRKQTCQRLPRQPSRRLPTRWHRIRAGRPSSAPETCWFSGSALFAGSMILATLAAVAFFLIIQSIPALGAGSDEASLISTNFWDYVWPLAVRNDLGRVPRPPDGRAALARRRAVHHRTTHRAASRRDSVTSSTCSRPSPPWSSACGESSCSRRPCSPSTPGSTRTWAGSRSSPGDVSATGRTIFTAAIVLAVMVVPIITAICREIFLQTPVLHEEAALALGATRWEMIRMAVSPVRPLGHRLGVDARTRPRPRRDDGRRDGALGHGNGHLPAVHLDEPHRRSPRTSRSRSPRRSARTSTSSSRPASSCSS